MTSDDVSTYPERELLQRELSGASSKLNNVKLMAKVERDASVMVATRPTQFSSEQEDQKQDNSGSYYEKSVEGFSDCIQILQERRKRAARENEGFVEAYQVAADRIFVVDVKNETLLGYILLEDLLFNPANCSVTECLRKCELILNSNERLEYAAKKIRHTGILCAPVVDEGRRFIGLISALDIIREVEFEAAEDFMLVSGLGNADMVQSYFETPLYNLVRGRLSWLVALLLFQSVSSVILSQFQNLIERHVVIALFLTMLTGTGGNAGNQSSAIVIRGLATGEINRYNTMRVIGREFRVAMVVACILSLVAFIRVFFTVQFDIRAALTVSVALFLIVVSAIVAGTVAPLLLEHCGADPAYCASPTLATATDIVGVLLFCTVAVIMLG
eukprot:jgi/Galph1/348/GphlegSOOS_G5059.1